MATELCLSVTLYIQCLSGLESCFSSGYRNFQVYDYFNNTPSLQAFRLILILSFAFKDCSVQALGRSFAKQLAHMTESLTQSVTIRHSNNTVKSDWASTIVFANSSKVHDLGSLTGTNITRSTSEDVEDVDTVNDPCLPTFQLARIKHAQDFADTFLLQVCTLAWKQPVQRTGIMWSWLVRIHQALLI